MQKNKIIYAILGISLGAIGFVGCNAEPPQETVSSVPAASDSVESEEMTATETRLAEVKQQLSAAVRDTDSYSRARRLGELLPTLGPESVPLVKETLADLLVDLRGAEFELLLRFWATYEPVEATRWAVKKTSRRYRIPAVYAAVAVWAENDPQGAAELAWEWIDIPDLDNIVLIALVRGWFAAGDPPELRQFIRALPAGIFRQRGIAAYLRVLLQAKGADAVVRWADSLSDEDEAFKLASHRRMIDTLSMLDIPAGVRWCEANCDGPYGKNARGIITRNWVNAGDPEAALEWAAGEKEGYEKELAVRLAYSRWAQLDRVPARDWLAARLAGGPVHWLEPTYAIYARIITEENPAEAIRWAGELKEEGQRLALVVKVAHAWHQLDEAAAERWLAESSLSAEALETVRDPLPRVQFSNSATEQMK